VRCHLGRTDVPAHHHPQAFLIGVRVGFTQQAEAISEELRLQGSRPVALEDQQLQTVGQDAGRLDQPVDNSGTNMRERTSVISQG
jgi:hypothetical protein